MSFEATRTYEEMRAESEKKRPAIIVVIDNRCNYTFIWQNNGLTVLEMA